VSLRSQIAGDVGTVFLEAGGFKETVSYLPAGVTSGEKNIDAIVEPTIEPFGGGSGFDSDMAPGLQDGAIIYANDDDIANPSYGDTITQGSNVWRVRQISRQEGMLLLYCITGERMS